MCHPEPVLAECLCAWQSQIRPVFVHVLYGSFPLILAPVVTVDVYTDSKRKTICC